MVTVLNRLSPSGEMAQSFGTGISNTLQGLAQQKMMSIAENQRAKKEHAGLRALNFSPDEALAIQGLSPEIQQAVIKQRLEAPQKEAYASALQSILGGPQDSYIQDGGDILTEGKSPVSAYSRQGLAPGGVQLAGINQKEMTDLAKLALKKESATKSEIAEHYKATQPYRKEILDSAKAARSDLRDLSRMQELNESGKLDQPGYIEMLKRSGMDIQSLMSPDTEEFQKIFSSFLRNAKQYFGARISNQEMEQFLKSIPNLSQSPEGRKRVIANLKYVKNAALLDTEALKEVINKNGGIPPFDLQEKVDTLTESRKDKLSDKFKDDLSKPVPKAEAKWKTTLLAGMGSTAGFIGGLTKPIGKAAIGAGIGALAGGPAGAAIGGISGGLSGL